VRFLFFLSPLLAPAVGALLLMLVDAFARPIELGSDRDRGRATHVQELALTSFIALMAAGLASVAVWMAGPEDSPELARLIPYLVLDRFSLFFCALLGFGAALVALLAGGYFAEHKLDRPEFFPLLLWSTGGAMGLSAAGDLVSALVTLETLSLGVYAMVGLRRTPRALEAALKYFLLGSFATALLLFGGALLYGATGHTDFHGLGQVLATLPASSSVVRQPGLVLLGVVLLLSGLAFKVAAVPFHMWAPDAYEGAPTPTTTFMAFGVKSAAFALLLRVLLVAFSSPGLASWGSGWPPWLAVLAVLTMTFANLVAGRQESVKRMLAYSSIAQAGYALLGVVAAHRSSAAPASVLFFLLAYAVSTAGAFGALVLAGSRGKEAASYDDLAGLGRRHPAIGLALSVCLLSLAGVPPTVGFLGKLGIFRAAIDAELYLLALIGLANAVVGAYYYLRVVVFLFMREPLPGAPVASPMRSLEVATAVLAATLSVLLLGVLPSPLTAASLATLLP
jgi:NADH-quinone oxidoreductase subunit N